MDHSARTMRRSNGVVGGGSFILDVVGLWRLRRGLRGVGGRLESRCEGLVASSDDEPASWVDPADTELREGVDVEEDEEGYRNDATYVSRRVSVFMVALNEVSCDGCRRYEKYRILSLRRVIAPALSTVQWSKSQRQVEDVAKSSAYAFARQRFKGQVDDSPCDASAGR